MKKIEKLIYILTMLSMILGICTNVFAAVSDFSGATEFGGADAPIKSILSAVLAVIRNVGVGIAFVMLMFIGCKYMLASAGERADIKKYAMNYVIGAIVMFAAATVVTIIKQFVDGSVTTTGT